MEYHYKYDIDFIIIIDEHSEISVKGMLNNSNFYKRKFAGHTKLPKIMSTPKINYKNLKVIDKF